MCIHWAQVLYYVVITRQSYQPISQCISPCNEFTSFWSMFLYNTVPQRANAKFVIVYSSGV